MMLRRVARTGKKLVAPTLKSKLYPATWGSTLREKYRPTKAAVLNIIEDEVEKNPYLPVIVNEVEKLIANGELGFIHLPSRVSMNKLADIEYWPYSDSRMGGIVSDSRDSLTTGFNQYLHISSPTVYKKHHAQYRRHPRGLTEAQFAATVVLHELTHAYDFFIKKLGTDHSDRYDLTWNDTMVSPYDHQYKKPELSMFSECILADLSALSKMQPDLDEFDASIVKQILDHYQEVITFYQSGWVVDEAKTAFVELSLDAFVGVSNLKKYMPKTSLWMSEVFVAKECDSKRESFLVPTISE